MKYFVKGSSYILLVVLIIIDLIELSGVIFDISLSGTRLKEATPSYIDGSEATIFDGLLTAFTGFVIAVLVVLALMIIAEIVIKIVLCRKAATENAYKYYKGFSIFSIIETIVNTLAWALILGLMGGEIPYKDEQTLTGFIIFMFMTKIILLCWLVLEFLGARQCVKDGL